MIRLTPSDRLYISEDLTGFADEMNSQGIVPRRIDLMFLGFGFAVSNNMMPTQEFKRHQLIQVALIDKDTLLAVESVAHWYAKEKGFGELKDEKELLDFICVIGITGMWALQERWLQKSKSQIQFDILGMGINN